jgi:hypothetical protein
MLDISLPEMAAGDLIGGTAGDWLVIGWFTEDPTYRPLAEAFAANLAEHGAPYHLFAKPAGKGWSTRRKPSVVLEAMDAHPGKTLVLMDVDCIVRGDIAPVAAISGDVGITVLARNMRKRREWRHWIATEASSRVVVFRPTEGARAFLRRWADQIERSHVNHDEHSMVWAFLASPDVSFSYIPQTYSGREASKLPDGVIVHDSAHDRQRRHERGLIKHLLRMIERPFRTGRTSAGKVHAELSVLSKA